MITLTQNELARYDRYLIAYTHAPKIGGVLTLDERDPLDPAHRTMREIAVQRAIGGKKKQRRIRRLPRQIPPALIAREYAGAIERMVDRARPAIERLREELPPILEAARIARGDGFRLDADETSRAHGLISRARDRLAAAISPRDIEEMARRFAHETSSYQRRQLGRQLHAAFGADVFARDANLARLAADFTARNVALIKSIPNRFADEVEAMVHSAVRSARSHPALADDIEERFGIGRRRAALISRDQIGKFYGDVNHARQKELGVRRFVWRTMRDERVRGTDPRDTQDHKALDGNTYEYSDPPDTGDGPAMPGEDVLCRCYAEPVLDDLLEE